MSSQLLNEIAALPNLFLAWKKAKTYLYKHSWYFDALDVELFEINLEDNLQTISIQLLNESYKPDDAHLVLAPKRIENKDDSTDISCKHWMYRDRPLAHCSLKDQTVWIAIINRIGDRFEDKFVSPDPEAKTNMNFGNRLYRTKSGNNLRFATENGKLYREYYRDYSNFLKNSLREADILRQDKPISLYECDLSKCYDKISTERLHEMLSTEISEQDVCDTLERLLFGWTLLNVKGENIRDASRGIPQGLAASGFLANVYLTPLDHWALEEKQKRNSRLLYYARYVDDLRVVIHRRGRPTDNPRILTQMENFLDERLCLQMNNDKKSSIDADKGSQPIRADQLAKRVSQLSWQASHMVTTEDARAVADELETILYLKIDNVAMRPDSKLRFGTNRLVKCWRHYKEIDKEFWEEKIGRLREWLYSEWKSDASLVALLRNYLEISTPNQLRKSLEKVVRHINTMEVQDEDGYKSTWQWYLRSAVYRCLRELLSTGCCPKLTRSLGIKFGVMLTQDLQSEQDTPWYVRRTAYLLAAVLPSQARPLLVEQVEELLGEESDYRVVEAQLCCLYAWSDRERLCNLLKRESPSPLDVVLFARRVGGYANVTDGDIRALVDVASRRNPALSRAVHWAVLQLGGDLRPRHLLMLSRVGVSQALVELTQRWHTWRNSGRALATLRNIPLYLDYEKSINDGYISLAELCEKGMFADELLLDSLITSISQLVIAENASIIPEGGILHPGNIMVRKSVSNDAVIFDLRLLSRLSDERYLDPSYFSKDINPRYYQNCWWQSGLALCAVAAARGSCDFSRDFSIARKFSAWLSYSALAAEKVHLSTYTASLLRRLLSWLPEMKGVTPRNVIEKSKNAAALLGKLRVHRTAGKDIQIAPLTSMKCKDANIRVGLAQLDVKWDDVRDGPFSTDLAVKLYAQLQTMVGAAIRRGLQLTGGNNYDYWANPPVHLLVLPELTCPRKSIPYLRWCASTFCMSMVVGLEYEDTGKTRINELLILIPVASDGSHRDLIEMYQPKLFPTDLEEAEAKNKGLSMLRGRLQFLVEETNKAAWAALDCYDFTCIELRERLRGRTDLLVVSSMNRDLNTFDHLSEASVRDLHAFVALSNSGEYGGSHILGPLHDHERTIFRIEGQNLSAAEVRELDIANLREFQRKKLMNPTVGKKSDLFKSLPAGYTMSDWRKDR